MLAAKVESSKAWRLSKLAARQACKSSGRNGYDLSARSAIYGILEFIDRKHRVVVVSESSGTGFDGRMTYGFETIVRSRSSFSSLLATPCPFLVLRRSILDRAAGRRADTIPFGDNNAIITEGIYEQARNNDSDHHFQPRAGISFQLGSRVERLDSVVSLLRGITNCKVSWKVPSWTILDRDE